MLQTLSHGTKDDRGFTLIELLVVILIIGILAAIAIPSFLNQKSKANDAAAKELARTAQTTAETVATDNSGDYSTVNKTTLRAAEASIPTVAGSNAWLFSASGSPTGYVVNVASVPTNNHFIITNTSGVITRTCSTAGTGGCSAGGTW